ncbi:MAG: tRNA (pseudouridine(54)-N(1))-methyltransferase TrmY [Candidatus Bathyarchaeota archaeon]|nr:tRNA (pseudouridine(54)-N(1))-methyltransferase TrmY [Candidatus Bathyarchaeota archaeon]
MREFLLYSRLGRTEPHWSNLHDAGRLDIVYECIVTSLFLSHGLRRDVTFHAVLNGPPNPPMHLQINGEELYDVRTDIDTWNTILHKAVNGKPHPGVTTKKTSFEALLKTKAQTNSIYILEEHGKSISEIELAENPLFILGDHVGLPKNAERYAQRYGTKVSLGKTPYLAASCITIINYLMDVQERKQRTSGAATSF